MQADHGLTARRQLTAISSPAEILKIYRRSTGKYSSCSRRCNPARLSVTIRLQRRTAPKICISVTLARGGPPLAVSAHFALGPIPYTYIHDRFGGPHHSCLFGLIPTSMASWLGSETQKISDNRPRKRAS